MSPKEAEPPPRLAGERICITIDDFPHQHGLSPHTSCEQLAEEILDAIERSFASRPAARPIFFVNSDRIVDTAFPLERLARIGMLGNHTASHCDVSAISFGAWQADVLRCQQYIEAYLDGRPRYFRFPFLRTGTSRTMKDAARRFLTDRGFIAVPGTCPTADWQFAEIYERAHLMGDEGRCEEICKAVVAHVLAALQNAVLERDQSPIKDAPLTLVLHANRLLAAAIEPLLRALADLGMVLDYPPLSIFSRFERYDDYVGSWGGSFLLQCTPEGRDALSERKDWLSLECARISAEY